MSSLPPDSLPPNDEAPKDFSSARMDLWEHLDELRNRLLKCLLIVAVGFCVTYSYSEQIIRFLEQPLLTILPDSERHLYFTGIADKFFIYFKVSVYSAIALTSPLLLFQIWKFISPALYERERRFAGPFIISATVAFLVGMIFAYTIVIPNGYKFLVEFGSPTDRPIITLTSYFSLTTQLIISMGLIFELPVILMLLGKFGIVRPGLLSKIRRQAYVVLTILAGFITPTPDAFTMIMVLIPLILLYELSVVLVKWVGTPASEPPS